MSELTQFGIALVVGGFFSGLIVGMVLRVLSHRR